eukprot:TRINITY_DN110811_c0_g1_i1.p1 TRINITY_DN110811_c0_g1~~TRINITY_DN110811_c0_g1_i1.p1  ORF type:complete len:397 (-),score=97.10 TRINITY_DN110811_c0_g1_i1:229-1419(-)
MNYVLGACAAALVACASLRAAGCFSTWSSTSRRRGFRQRQDMAVARGLLTARHAGAADDSDAASVGDSTDPEAIAALARAASSEDAAAAKAAYEVWADQFPIAAARQDFYNMRCTPEDVQGRFLFVARQLEVSAPEALDIFRRDMWVLSEPSEKIPEKVATLKEVAKEAGAKTDDEVRQELLDFLRLAPRSIGTTTVLEMKERGLADMKFRAVLGEAFEATIAAPTRFFFKQMAKGTASRIASEGDEKANEGMKDERKVGTSLFFGSVFAILVYVGYLDSAYGGPIHGKGICAASPIPTFNLPDAEGNTRLPCNCAPIYKWYIEPLLEADARASMPRPAVESKNCGRQMGGEKKECNPLTPGACVWTAEDLDKDPSYWDARKPTYYEQKRMDLERK